MKEQVETARETFRKLAVLEIDPGRFLAADTSPQLFEAVNIVDEIFWRQVLPDVDYRSVLEAIEDEELREMFLFNRGPYDRFNHNAPFLPVDGPFSRTAFYPRGLTREEFEKALQTDLDTKRALESPYTVIERRNEKLSAVPYHIAYGELVQRLASLLGEASATESNREFSEFLAQRSKDILVDEYFASDALWVRLEDNPIDLAIGPYEVYEDHLMGLKAAYEAILFERDLAESERICHLRQELSSLCSRTEKHLGRSLHVEDTSVKLSVAKLIYAGGDARKAVPALAFCLPNDERVIEEVGSRQVILKNVLEAKFKLVAQKISNRVLQAPLEDEGAAFRDFFDHTLFHEISHSIGPKRIMVNGEETTVNRSLKQYFSVLEETKADTLGASLMVSAVDNLDQELFLAGYVGRFIRAIRFGLEQAHGGANAIQFNYLLQESAFTVDPVTISISVNPMRARAAVFGLASKILSIQESGDFEAARRFVASFCVASPEIEALNNAVKDFPIDIRIRYGDWRS